jgi:hypothetical protein
MEFKNLELVTQQALQVTEKYSHLVFSNKTDGFLLKGVLAFKADHQGEIFADDFDVEIHIPESYPSEMPLVKEVGNRIPRDYHVNQHDNSLCLAAPIAVKMKFSEGETLLCFIESLVIPYFYNFLYQQKYGFPIFGELSHGHEGILEFYKQYFQHSEDAVILELLRILAMDDYWGYSQCPCNSGKKLRNCHGRKLLQCMFLQTVQEFKAEYWGIRDFLLNKDAIIK